LGAAGLIAFAACAGQAGADEAKLRITPQAWQGYMGYLAFITPVGDGFFAVSKDGRGWAGVGCSSGECYLGAKAQQKAKNDCAKASGGQECIIFATGHDIVVHYEVAQ
jgi:hypothetical protein